MSLFALFAVMITLTALLSWVNERYLRLPQTIGVMLAALCLSLVLIALGNFGWLADRWAENLLGRVDFSNVLMQGMLSFLLFAGALHVDLAGLLERKWTILLLSTLGVTICAALVGSLFYGLCRLLGLDLPLLHALLFGALISPTDPIAVLGVLKQARVPQSLELKIVGESLFNDGIGVVLFTLLVGFAAGAREFSWLGVGELLAEEVLGGVLIGLLLGYVAYRLLRAVDNYTVEILITLSLVSAGYTLAGGLHASGPIAMVVAGLLIGNHGRVLGMSDESRARLDSFWELVDEILNALLFVMIGLEVLVLDLTPSYLLTGVIGIALVLGARFVSVGLPIGALRLWRPFEPHTVKLLTWAGLRGGISIALALSLPASAHRDLLLVVTYTVVVFSILVQGLTVGRLVRWTTGVGAGASLRRGAGG